MGNGSRLPLTLALSWDTAPDPAGPINYLSWPAVLSRAGWGKGNGPFSSQRNQGKGGERNAEGGEGCARPDTGEWGWRGQGTRSSSSSRRPSVTARGWQRSGSGQQRCPQPPSILSTPGRGNPEHPGFRAPSNPIPDSRSHSNPSLHLIKHELKLHWLRGGQGRGEGGAAFRALQPSVTCALRSRYR